ncbi:hypothetical protein COCON_G00072730 [Conger conger]|uniref:Uncharacterized protein n=1 Tax=Conger conger TaxID=82655 RepID=A0A9Q1DNT9_CONCO|nr:hypothetical protein COCON_G00072730 [Conger conger]
MTCENFYIALAFLAIALAISLGLNVIFCSLRRRDARRKAAEESPGPETEAYGMQSHEGDLEQDNPIYGNINPDGTGVVYEPMTPRAREQTPCRPPSSRTWPTPPWTCRWARNAGRRTATSRAGAGEPSELLEVEAAVEPGLPCRDSSPLASRNSIYLNSQQMALESEELERRLERERDKELNLR